MVMRFGYTLPNNWGVADPADVVGLAPLIEERGYHSVWVNHHVLNVGYVADRLGDRPYHDALTVLTWVAARTARLRLGTSVLVMPYLNPVGLAKTLATLDQLSGGRVTCGVGVGSLQPEHEATSPHLPYAERGAFTDAALQTMRDLWAGNWDGLVASPRPRQARLPIVVGGNKRPALRRVARFGDGWHPLGVSPEGLGRRLAVLDEELAAAGRSRSEIEVSLRWDVRPDTDVGERLAAYAAAGVSEVVWSVGSPDIGLQREMIERLAPEA
jgi:probable F420-dependent oxidoreductase